MTGGALVYHPAATYLQQQIPNGSLKREQLAADVRLPDPTGNAGKYARVDDTGTGWEVVEVEYQRTGFAYHIYGAPPINQGDRTYPRTQTFTGWLQNDLVSFTSNVQTVSLAPATQFKDIPTTGVQVVPGSMIVTRTGANLVIHNTTVREYAGAIYRSRLAVV